MRDELIRDMENMKQAMHHLLKLAIRKETKR